MPTAIINFVIRFFPLVDGKFFYLHSGRDHSALSHLADDPRVCLVLGSDPLLEYRDKEVGCTYTQRGASVIVHGTVEFIAEQEEKKLCLDIIMRHYTDQVVNYSAPAIANVAVWRILPNALTARQFGRLRR